MTRMREWAGMIGLGLLVGVMWGCGGSADGPDGEGLKSSSSATPTIIVDGSSTVFRISKAAQEGFNRVNPEVTVVVDNHGTGGGFGRYLEGEVDIIDASRPAEPNEESKAKAQGIDWTRFTVGYDGITLVINPKNDFVKTLTVDQLKTLWAPGSKVRTWSDLNPAWPARKIILYSPDNDSGTFEFFTEAIVGKKKSQRDDVQQSADDNTLVNGVAGDPDGLGYFGYAYYAANTDKLGALAVQNGTDAKPVLPSPKTILDKTYAPLSRPLFIYVKNSASRRPEVAQFVKYYLENIDLLTDKGRYVAPTAEDKATNTEALNKLLSGGGGGGEAKVPAGKAG